MNMREMTSEEIAKELSYSEEWAQRLLRKYKIKKVKSRRVYYYDFKQFLRLAKDEVYVKRYLFCKERNIPVTELIQLNQFIKENRLSRCKIFYWMERGKFPSADYVLTHKSLRTDFFYLKSKLSNIDLEKFKKTERPLKPSYERVHKPVEKTWVDVHQWMFAIKGIQQATA